MGVSAGAGLLTRRYTCIICFLKNGDMVFCNLLSEDNICPVYFFLRVAARKMLNVTFSCK